MQSLYVQWSPSLDGRLGAGEAGDEGSVFPDRLSPLSKRPCPQTLTMPGSRLGPQPPPEQLPGSLC